MYFSGRKNVFSEGFRHFSSRQQDPKGVVRARPFSAAILGAEQKDRGFWGLEKRKARELINLRMRDLIRVSRSYHAYVDHVINSITMWGKRWICRNAIPLEYLQKECIKKLPLQRFAPKALTI